ncbi:glycosyltransferase family 4 protein [Opitutus sp. ER46]|uniref:glycosyltransferase family 4 protein n=1 Tax=Opitutus sp. ER46 TaxID=2161864 RepID=UPI0011B1F853|nr:glycosyltransferase family 4 protein [Opitutus sp. ER46]
MARERVIWIVSEVFYPEETSTGHYMTRIAAGLSKTCRVKAICARPTYSRRGTRVPSHETWQGIEIFRCWSTALNKNVLPLRLVNLVTVTLGIFAVALRCFRRGDAVLVVTNPPSLPFLVYLAARMRGARCVLRVDDLYPEAMIIAGLVRNKGLTARLVNAATRWLYSRMSAIVVLGRDMAHRVHTKAHLAASRVVVIPNWSDSDEVRPALGARNALLLGLGLQTKFVVGYAGNLGPLQGIPFLVDCAEHLRGDTEVQFLFVGSGKMVPWLKEQISARDLSNITVVGQRPRSEQNDFLNACDVGLVSLVPGMAGVGVPSRSYNLLAAGKPILACVETDSEIAQLIVDERVGWIVAPGDHGAFRKAVLAAKADRPSLIEMGRRARSAAEGKYSFETIIRRYEQVLVAPLPSGSRSEAGVVSSSL